MKQLFDDVSIRCSQLTTRAYSSSFSIGVRCLGPEIRNAVYAIYGFVRFADEIVDTFHDYDKQFLFESFKSETWKAIEHGISLNPILNSFQHAVNKYKIDHDLIVCFLKSMETDLSQAGHDRSSYDDYIVGSAEVVGLMCLRVFTENNDALYQQLKAPAMKLGSAFQKVNFLRDFRDDYEHLGRMYFPGVDFRTFSDRQKQQIEKEIDMELQASFQGIMMLPVSSRFGVYVAFIYYRALFNKIRSLPSSRILTERIRISTPHKLRLLLTSYFRHSLSIL
jgi:phytoene/squalene synthetase